MRTRRHVLAALLIGSASGPAVAADESARMPGWTVLVLQPVGDQRVRPATGVVIDRAGSVLVPAAFAGPDDVLIVLDGGTDIFEHGRAATVRFRDESAGVAVLTVSGLRREPARVPDESRSGTAWTLAAFPPAERIAEGDAFVWRSVPSDRSGDAGLPNVSGALIDTCGRLAGYHLPAGIPGLTPAEGARIVRADTLRAVFDREGLSVATAPCDTRTGAAAASPDESAGAQPAVKGAVDDDRSGIPAATVAPEAAPAARNQPAGGFAPPPWVWSVAAGLVAAAAFLVWRARRPRTPPLLQDIVGRRSRIGAGRGGAGQSRQGRWDLVVRATLPGGAEIEKRVGVQPAAVDVTIGSGDDDVRLLAPGVGARHVRIGGRAGALTVSGNGLPGGTWIGRAPVLRGEIFFLAADDTLVLGEAQLRLHVAAPDAVETP